MDKILHAGTVVEARGMKLLILGTSLVNEEGRAALRYRAVCYPRGFTGAESLRWLPPEAVTGICAEGYEDEAAHRYHEHMDDNIRRLMGLKIEEAEGEMRRSMEERRAAIGQEERPESGDADR